MTLYEINDTDKLNSSVKLEKWRLTKRFQSTVGFSPTDTIVWLMQQNIDGKISVFDIEEELDKSGCKDDADLVTVRIYKVLCDDSFGFNPGMLKNLNRILFIDIHEDAGRYRDDYVDKLLDEVFQQEAKEQINEMSLESLAKHIAKLGIDIYRIKPFHYGNIRTTLVFIERYLNFLGLKIDYNLYTKFVEHLKAGLECEAELYLTEFFKNVIEL